MKISVITTLYNYRNYIEQAVRSFENQTFAGAEMIIVDDASKDSPQEVIKPYLSDRIRYIRLDQNKGYSHAKNVGIRQAKADVLVMIDADDMLTSNSLEVRYAKLQEGFDFVHGPVLDLRDDRKQKQSKLWKKWMESKKNAKCYKLVHAQSVMLRKSIHTKVGLYDESLRSKSDREMWARIFNHGFKIGWVGEPVSVYRMHPKQMHRSKEKARINDKLQKEVLKRIARRAKDLSDVEMLQS